MIKKFVKHEYNEIGRQYLFDDGSKYYSVTTMLGATKDQTFLKEWRNKVGRQKAEAITRSACNIGTAMHECLEQYMLGNKVVYPNAVIKMLSKQIIPYLDKRIKTVYDTEKVLYSDKFKLAGTADGIVSYHINQEYPKIILDFKTAKRHPRMSWVRDYLTQLAIYALMMEEIYDTTIDYGVLLFAYKKVQSPLRELPVKLKPYKIKAIQRINQFHEMITSNKKKLDI